MNKNIPASERRDLWVEIFSDEDWDYGQWIVEALSNHLDALENIIGADKVADPFQDLLAEAVNMEGGWGPMPWREALENVGPAAWSSWEMGECFRQLGLYGLYGVTDANIPLDERESLLENLLERGEEFIKAAGFDQSDKRGQQPVKVVRLAQARRALDTGKGEIEPASLAILGGWSEGRVRNMMSGADRVFENNGGRVPASSALAVLAERPAYFDSIWRKADDALASDEQAPLSDVLFVPLSRDGTHFHPGLRRGGGYTIGPKGAEITHPGFDEALTALHRMSEPAWRRPNAVGNWGIVKGVDWVRMERAALERISQ